MKHLHTLGIVFGFKTATTCCGKRVKLADLAIDQDTDCPGCRTHAEQQHTDISRLLDSYEADGDLDTLRSEHVARLREILSAGPKLRNAVLAFPQL